MLGYPHRVRILAPRTGGSAAQDRVTGLLSPVTPADEVTVYAGDADLQDREIRGSSVEDGVRVVLADGVGYLASEDAVRRLAPGHLCLAVDAYGRTRDAEIVSVRDLDASFLYRWRKGSGWVAEHGAA